jgi:phenylalanyl-tRNA synthetase beta chain
MKFAFNMLKDFVETAKSAEQVGDLLTMAGFELEGIEEVEGEMMLDIKVVSNRGDGLSVLGLAREVLAKDADSTPTELYKRAQARFPMADADQELPAGIASVEILAHECDRYAARAFAGDFNLPSPNWIQKRLRIGGVRPISLLVDLTNYVMLEVGQPLHAFDLDKLSGNKIVVRTARPGEKLTTLNGEEHELNGQMMICDGKDPVGVPGVMGGLASEVTDTTKRILLESAHFESTNVRKTRKQLGLSTEASYRFERSVDPEGCVAALNRFAELLAEAGSGASRIDGIIDVRSAPKSLPTIHVRSKRVCALLGMEVPAEVCRRYLDRLGFVVGGDGEDFEVTPPSWRPDVVQEYDVVEEIGRVHGYEMIPEAPLKGTTTQGGVFGFDRFVESVRDTAIRLGFVQNISTSLLDAHPLDDPRGKRIGPRHPNSPEMALLRNSLWPNLADNARRNGGSNLCLFEIGSVFGAPNPDGEVRQASFIATGGASVEHWEKAGETAPSFFSLKSAVEEVVRQAGQVTTWQIAHDPRLHPTRQASAHNLLLGQIHPDKAEELGLPTETYLAEIDLASLYAQPNQPKRMFPISRNPAVRRDIAVLVDKSVPYDKLRDAVGKACGPLLEKQWLIDVYSGKGIPEGKHSLTLALQIRKMGENLTDEEANQVRDRAVQALAAFGALQR